MRLRQDDVRMIATAMSALNETDGASTVANEMR
jgi:hypothetical protein